MTRQVGLLSDTSATACPDMGYMGVDIAPGHCYWCRVAPPHDDTTQMSSRPRPLTCLVADDQNKQLQLRGNLFPACFIALGVPMCLDAAPTSVVAGKGTDYRARQRPDVGTIITCDGVEPVKGGSFPIR